MPHRSPGLNSPSIKKSSMKQGSSIYDKGTSNIYDHDHNEKDSIRLSGRSKPSHVSRAEDLTSKVPPPTDAELEARNWDKNFYLHEDARKSSRRGG